MDSERDFFALSGGLSLQVTHFTVNRARCDKLHSLHPVNRLLFIRQDTAGESRISDREAGAEFLLRPGMVYFMPCFREVEVHLTPELEFLSVHFTLDLFGGTDIFQKQPVAMYPAPDFAAKAWSGLQEGRALYAACELKSAVYGFCTRTLMRLGPGVDRSVAPPGVPAADRFHCGERFGFHNGGTSGGIHEDAAGRLLPQILR